MSSVRKFLPVCGISASLGSSPGDGAAVVDRINAAQHRRGPDGVACFVEGSVALGNSRLAIISTGWDGDQPLRSANGDVVAVFNGEIYNYRELIRDHGLTSGGSDGAVIPQLFARLGVNAFKLLRGMFAVVLADLGTGTTYLVRDPLGIKPLHWRRAPNGTVTVASDIRPLLEKGDRPTPSAVAQFLHLGSLPAPETPFEEIETLPPNGWLAFHLDGSMSRGSVVDDLLAPCDTARPLRDALIESVDLHLRSDVPSALLLSGGLDSGAIAWAAAQSGHRLHTLTVDMGEAGGESVAAAATAREYGHQHEVVRTAPTPADLPDFFRAMQRPSIDGLNTFVVSRAVSASGHKVALTGIGGDELSAGYRHFRFLPLLRVLRAADRVPLVNTMLTGLPMPVGKQRALLTSTRDAWQLSLLQRQVWRPECAARATGISGTVPVAEPPGHGLTSRELSLAEYRSYLQPTLLQDADAYSMAASVELRLPLVDVPFAQAALDTRPARGLGKIRFAAALGDPWLKGLAKRPKQGFSLPMAAWMRGGVLAGVVAGLADPQAPVWTYVDPAVGRQVLAAWTKGEGRWAECWALAALDGWLRQLP